MLIFFFEKLNEIYLRNYSFLFPKKYHNNKMCNNFCYYSQIKYSIMNCMALCSIKNCFNAKETEILDYTAVNERLFKKQFFFQKCKKKVS